jgi:tetratricopeptide (TPR) repeat protein
MNSTEVQNIFKLALGCEEVGDYCGVLDYLVALSNLIHDPNHKRRCLKIVCRNYNRVGNYRMAMAHAFDIMVLLSNCKEQDQKRDYAKAQHQVMIALMGLKDKKACEKMAVDAVDYLFKNKLNGTVMHARFYIACAQAGLLNKNYKSVFESYNKARGVLDSVESSIKHHMTVLCGLADYYVLYANKQYKESNQIMKTALSILDEAYPNTLVYTRTSVLQRLASSYVGLYQFELAHMCLQEAHNIAYTLLGPNDSRTHFVSQQVLVLKQELEHVKRLRPCDMCGTKGEGPICGKQACMEKMWMTRGCVDSLVCRGCSGRFAILDKKFFCKKCKA